MSIIPFTVISCSTKSDEHPAKNLEREQLWQTDIPTSRCTLHLRLIGALPFGKRFAVHRVGLKTSLATHIEIRGYSIAQMELGRQIRGKGELEMLKKTELYPMFQHKVAFGSGSSRKQEKDVIGKFVEFQTLKVAEGFIDIEVNVLCLWEPVHQIGLDSLRFIGEVITPPPVPPSVAPTAIPPLPPAPAPLKRSRESDGQAPAPPPQPKMEVEGMNEWFPVAFDDAGADASLPPPLERKDTAPPATAASAVPSTIVDDDPKPLKGCVVVLSGYQNPLRSEIRDKALTLGAKVQGDWSAAATHLVCAAPNTPKFGEVCRSGHGYIVTKEWVLRAFETKVRQKETLFRLTTSKPAPAPSSETHFVM